MIRLSSCLVALAILLAPASGLAAPKVGDAAPPMKLVTYDGREIALADLRGKVVILNYWATWCAPCRVELPELDNYLRRHKGKDLAIYAVEVSGAPKSKLGPLASVLSFEMVSRLKGRDYGRIGGAVPTNYVIDRAGVLRHAKAGAFNAKTLEEVVTPLLREPAPSATAAASP